MPSNTTSLRLVLAGNTVVGIVIGSACRKLSSILNVLATSLSVAERC